MHQGEEYLRNSVLGLRIGQRFSLSIYVPAKTTILQFISFVPDCRRRLIKELFDFLHLFLLGKLEINEAFSLRTMHALLFRGPIRVGNIPGFN